MYPAQRFSLIIGILYVAMGLFGLIPGLVAHSSSMPAIVEDLGVVSGYGLLFGLFPVNTAHSLIHLTIGLVGIASSIALDSARMFSGQLGLGFLGLAILGMIPVANTFFGLFPLYGSDVVLHGITGLLGIYFGFFATPSLRKVLMNEVRQNQVTGASDVFAGDVFKPES